MKAWLLFALLAAIFTATIDSALAVDSLVVSGNGGYELSSTTGTGYDQHGGGPGGVSGDSQSKTVTVTGIGAFSKPLGAAYGNHTFDYSVNYFGQGTATYGTISGAMSFDAKTTPDHVDPTNPCCSTINNEGHALLSANVQMAFNESGVITSPSLPNGTPITAHFTIASEGFSIYLGRPTGIDSNGGVDKAFGSGSLQIFDHTSLSTLSPSYGMGTIQTYNLNTTVGSRIDVTTEFDLNVGAFAGKDGSSPFSPFYPEVQGSINSLHTTKLFIDASGDVSFVSDSGHNYALQLHPPTMSPITIAASGSTTIPSGSGTFTGFGGHASLSSGNSAYYGTGSSGQKGVFLQSSGVVNKLADLNTAIPGGSGSFVAFGIGAIPGDPCVNGNVVTFFGAGSSGQQGIYRASSGGAVSKVADLATAIPGGTGSFTGFSVNGIPGDPCINGDTVAFFGAGSSGQQGIYRAVSSGAALKVADLNTAIPGGIGSFTSFSVNGIPGDPCISGDAITFFGAGSSGQQGVYRATSGAAPTVVVNSSTAVPQSSGNFTAFSAQSVDPSDASNIAVIGSGSTVKGIYASVGGGALTRIADTTMTIPGSTSTFADFQSVSIDPADVAFLAIGSAGEKGIFADIGGTMVNVVSVEDTIGSKLIADLDFGPQGFSESSGSPVVTYRATFSDGSAGIFTAAITTPSIPGDFNGNGTVDAADYVVWRDGLGTTYVQSDYDVWRSHFGQTAGSGSAANEAQTIPEPGSGILLLTLASVAGLKRRPSTEEPKGL